MLYQLYFRGHQNQSLKLGIFGLAQSQNQPKVFQSIASLLAFLAPLSSRLPPFHHQYSNVLYSHLLLRLCSLFCEKLVGAPGRCQEHLSLPSLPPLVILTFTSPSLERLF